MNSRLIIALAAVLLILSCKKKTEEKKEEQKDPAVKRNTALIIGNPMDCGLDNMQLFPVGANYKPAVYGNTNEEIRNKMREGTVAFSVNTSGLFDKSASTEYVNSNEEVFDIRNILFYSLNTGKSYPLISDTIHILSFALHREFVKPMIFYRIVKIDYNKDSLYNSSDPVLLYISDLNGKGLVQVTPDNEQFLDYFYYPTSKTILVKTALDNDKDTAFTASDETNFREVQLMSPAMGREIFSKSLKDSLRL
jgi:hypothetical protein